MNIEFENKRLLMILFLKIETDKWKRFTKIDFEPPLNLIFKTNELLDQCKTHITLENCQNVQDQQKYALAKFYIRRDLEKQYQIWKY